MDGLTGELLWSLEGHTPVYPASLTKVATCILAIDLGRLDLLIESDVDHETMRASTVMGLKPGMVLTLEDLLFGLMLPSGNDAALAIARGLMGTEQRFAAAMTERARQIGAVSSNFVNPHGLDFGEANAGHQSTAIDLAVLARWGMAMPDFARIARAQHRLTAIDGGTWVSNLNRLLGWYPGADGVKVGYTRRAGLCLCGSAVRNGRRVIAVALNSPNPTADCAAMLDWGFAAIRERRL
jgi:D-alanyl-D-alanine carboxypeptidase